jgi:hypothetical protein
MVWPVPSQMTASSMLPLPMRLREAIRDALCDASYRELVTSGRRMLGVAVSYNNGPKCVTGAHLARTCLRRGSVRAAGAWWGDGGCVEVQFSWDCRRRKSQVCSEVDQQDLTKRLCEGLYAVWKGDCLLGGVVARTDPLVGQKAMDRKLEWGQCCNGRPGPGPRPGPRPGRRRDNLKTVECDNDCLGMIVIAIAPSCSCLPERGVGVSHASVPGQAVASSVMSTHEQAGLSARLPPDHTGLHARSQDC